MSARLADELYFFMKASQSLYSCVSAHCGSVGSLAKPAEIMPAPFSRPALFITVPTEFDTEVRKCVGFQPMSETLRIDCAANLGVASLPIPSAPLDCSDPTRQSTVGSVVS